LADSIYWLMNPLDPEDVRILRRIQAGTQPFRSDRFQVAYLIARRCVKADFTKWLLTLTPKGEDACRFYEEK